MGTQKEYHTGLAKALEYDVVVVGAALGGLVTAAILANRGFKVAVVDALDHPGGKVGATPYRGHWVNLGHRDGINGIADVGQPQHYRRLAEKEAGITIPVRKGAAGGDKVRVIDPGTGKIYDIGMVDITGSSGVADALESYRVRIRNFVPEADPDQIGAAAEDLKAALDKLAGISEEEAWSLVPVKLGDWVARNVKHPLARQCIFNQMEFGCTSPAEDASVGRIVLSLAWHYAGPDWVVDPEVGGMQTMIQPWVRAIEAKGGDVWLGWKPIEIVVDTPKATSQASGRRGAISGVVALNTSNLVQEFKAPIVVTDYWGWNLPDLIDRYLLPADFLEAAEKTRECQSEGIGWIGSFNRLPRLKSTGEVETFAGFTRVLYGKGLPRFYHCAFHWTSLADPGAAPKDKYQMNILCLHHGHYDKWQDTKGAIDYALSVARDFYIDFDDCLEWGRHVWALPPQFFAWQLKPVYRHPVKVSTIDGLYCASSTAEGMAGWVDIEHQNAIEACNLIDVEFGRPDGTKAMHAGPRTNKERGHDPNK